MPCRGKLPGLPIDAPELHGHELHRPIAAGGFRQADEFAAHRFTDEHQLAPPLDLPIRTHAPYLMGRVVPGILEPAGIGPG